MKSLVFTLLLIVSFSSAAAPIKNTTLKNTTLKNTPIKNTLKQHASPYLAMHGDDPVAWQEWNEQTVARAKKEGKLIFVSSGYFSCHWCHVMQRESYKNTNVAKILNNFFIPVKVDREINSALDSHLIDFVERTQGRAGWPLNVFITPQGYPLVGMTYVPTDNFIAILNNLKDKWINEKETLESIAKQATDELTTVEVTRRSSKIKAGSGKKHLLAFLADANNYSDDMSGGFGEQNKFPSVPQLDAMLTAYAAKPDEDLRHFLLLTLNKMATQGLNDQLSGGFFRYTVDPNWQIPHFEKMLYDNALLASLYLDAAKILENPFFAHVARTTLNYMQEVFRSEQGAYIASLSAVDNNDVEGGYYLWQHEELKNALTKDEMALVELLWQLDGVEDIEGGHHLVEVMSLADAAKMLHLEISKATKDLNSAKKKMLNIRNKRIIPRDDKLLAAWNGLALSAYAKAAKQFNDVAYAKAAAEIKNYIYKNLWKNNTLYRAVKNNKTLAEGGLEDYAYVAQGLSDWFEYEHNELDQEWLNQLIKQAWQRFYSKKGWLLAQNMLLKYGQGESVIADGVLPSPSAILIRASLFTPKSRFKDDSSNLKSILAAVNIGNPEITQSSFWYASHIVNLLRYQESNHK